MHLAYGIRSVAHGQIRLGHTLTWRDERELDAHFERLGINLHEITTHLHDPKRMRMSMWRHLDNVPAKELYALLAKRPKFHQLEVFLLRPLLEARRRDLFNS